MRIRKKTWTMNEMSTNKKLIVQPENLKGSWNEYFGNNNPIHIEIGSGKGSFITKTAKANPNINYIAIEKEKHVIVMGMKSVRESEISLAFIIGNVSDLLDYFEEGEVERIYINFCDPWQNRKKWQKRRLTHKNFLNIYKGIFGSKGEIHFKTDNTELFEFSLNEFLENGFMCKDISLDLHKGMTDTTDIIMTEYEEKFFKKGNPIYRCEAYYSI